MVDVGVGALNALTPKEVAALLRCSEKTVRRKCYSGELGSIKVGTLLRVTPRQLAEYQAKLAGQPAEGAA